LSAGSAAVACGQDQRRRYGQQDRASLCLQGILRALQGPVRARNRALRTAYIACAPRRCFIVESAWTKKIVTDFPI